VPDRRLFDDDPVLDRAESRVVEEGTEEGAPWVRLEQTLFYPQGGGQPADRGTIGGVAVVDVQTRDRAIRHVLAHPLGLHRGQPVPLVLDAARRLDHRQQHTAQHLVTALLADRHRRSTTSFHLGERHVAIEIEGAPPPGSFLAALEEEVNTLIREDRAVRTCYVEPAALAALPVRTRGLPRDHEGPVRLVEIEGLDLNTCGGTHVRRLGEIQAVHVVGVDKARGGTRLSFVAGGRVLVELRRAAEVEEAVRTRIGTAPESFAEVLDTWTARRRALERRVRDLESALAAGLGAALAAQPGPRLTRVVPEAGPDLLRGVAAAALSLRPEAVVVLVGQGCYLVQTGPAGPDEASSLGDRLRLVLGGAGGGRGRMHQGRFETAPQGEALERALASL
jgi:alanyl-tRNA synthetase